MGENKARGTCLHQNKTRLVGTMKESVFFALLRLSGHCRPVNPYGGEADVVMKKSARHKRRLNSTRRTPMMCSDLRLRLGWCINLASIPVDVRQTHSMKENV